jgi:hypothetical protein
MELVTAAATANLTFFPDERYKVTKAIPIEVVIKSLTKSKINGRQVQLETVLNFLKNNVKRILEKKIK